MRAELVPTKQTPIVVKTSVPSPWSSVAEWETLCPESAVHRFLVIAAITVELAEVGTAAAGSSPGGRASAPGLLVNHFEPMSHRPWRGAPFTFYPVHSSMLVGKIILRSRHRILLLKDDVFHLRSVTRKSDFYRAGPPIRWQICVHVNPYLIHIEYLRHLENTAGHRAN
jgi:hypothetical protein